MIGACCLGQQDGRGEGEVELLVYAELCYSAPHLVVGAAVGEHGGETFLQVPLGAEKWGGYVRTHILLTAEQIREEGSSCKRWLGVRRSCFSPSEIRSFLVSHASLSFPAFEAYSAAFN